jgi:hypothetical protein
MNALFGSGSLGLCDLFLLDRFRITRLEVEEESKHMPETNMITLNERNKETAHQNKAKPQTEQERFAKHGISRFPSVDSVLDEIDAFLETHGRVA